MTLKDPLPQSAIDARTAAMYRKLLKDHSVMKMRRARGVRLRRTFPRSGR